MELQHNKKFMRELNVLSSNCNIKLISFRQLSFKLHFSLFHIFTIPFLFYPQIDTHYNAHMIQSNLNYIQPLNIPSER